MNNSSLIIGASGLIGGYLYRSAPGGIKISGTFHNFSLPGLVRLEINKRPEVEKLILNCRPDTVFLPAAFTNVDLCEETPDLCYEVNVASVRCLSDILKDTKTKLIYFSTDYVFDGKNGPYSEDEPPEPLGIYGKSKLEGETIIKNCLDNYLIIRTTCVYGWEPQEKNFIVNLIKKTRSGRTAEVPVDQVTTPTYAGHLARSIWGLVKDNKTGIYNIAGATLISRFDFALMAAEIFGLDKAFIKPVTTVELNRKAKRPLKGGLKTDKIKRELNTEVPQAQQGLEAMKKETER